MQRALIIFAKYPKTGYVKSRLGASIGNEQAVCIYKGFVETLLLNLRAEEYKIYIFFTPEEKETAMKEWLGEECAFIAQKGNDLGMRLVNAFEYVFNNGANQAVVIGTDSPLIEKENILNAFSLLDKKDCVIGPAYDGGYYLLGLNCLQSELFALDEYSTNEVFEKTMEKARNLGLKVEVLNKNFDIDTVDDLSVLKQELGKSNFCKNNNYNMLREILRRF